MALCFPPNPALATPPTGRTVGAGEFSVSSGGSTLAGFSDANTTNPSGTPATTGSAGVAVSGSYTVSSTESATINLTMSDAAGSSTFNMYLVDPTLKPKSALTPVEPLPVPLEAYRARWRALAGAGA